MQPYYPENLGSGNYVLNGGYGGKPQVQTPMFSSSANKATASKYLVVPGEDQLSVARGSVSAYEGLVRPQDRVRPMPPPGMEWDSIIGMWVPEGVVGDTRKDLLRTGQQASFEGTHRDFSTAVYDFKDGGWGATGPKYVFGLGDCSQSQNRSRKSYDREGNQGWGNASRLGDELTYEIRHPNGAAPITIDQHNVSRAAPGAPNWTDSRMYSQERMAGRWNDTCGHDNKGREAPSDIWYEKREDVNNGWNPPGLDSDVAHHQHDPYGAASHPVQDGAWVTRRPAPIDAQGVLAQMDRTILQDEIEYLHQRIDQQEVDVEHYKQMAAQDKARTASKRDHASGAVGGLAKEVQFLRSCISNNTISLDDRYKALGILSSLQANNQPSPLSRLPAPVEASDKYGNDSAIARVENQMAAMSRDIIKINAYNKFQRMQQDSDRLARIEAKLASSKLGQGNHLLSAVEGAARELDKLGARVFNLKEFSRDGTARADIKSQVRAVSDQVKQLQGYVQDCTSSQHAEIKQINQEMMYLERRLDTMWLARTGSGVDGWDSGHIDGNGRGAQQGNGWEGSKSSQIPPCGANDGWVSRTEVNSRRGGSSSIDTLWGKNVPSRGRWDTRSDTPASQKSYDSWGSTKRNDNGSWCPRSLAESGVDTGSKAYSRHGHQSSVYSGRGVGTPRWARLTGTNPTPSIRKSYRTTDEETALRDWD